MFIKNLKNILFGVNREAASPNSGEDSVGLHPTSCKEDTDIYGGFQWIAALDLQTCLKCAALDGKTWNLKGEPIGHNIPFPQSDIHEGCRCVKYPITKSWKELGFDLPEMSESTRSSMFGPVSGELNYEQWFHKHVPEELKQRYLGDQLYTLYKEGMTSFFELAKHGERTPVNSKEVKSIMARIESPKTGKTELPKINNELALPNYDWRISVSFGKSSSVNFERALYLAQSAPEYQESEGLYQATYSADPEEYLAFVKLYELVSAWKSAHVMINGHLTDRKIVGNINYCYGDKCRSGNSDFCFGASYFTVNPFGCHRLQMSAFNSPWTEFFYPISDGKYMLDKSKMKKRIDEKGRIFSKCPAFDYKAIIDRLNSLPSVVTEAEFIKLTDQNGHFDSININITI